MEDSREGKGDGEKGRRMPDPYVDDKKGRNAIVYKTRKGKKRGERSLRLVKKDFLLHPRLGSLIFLH